MHRQKGMVSFTMSCVGNQLTYMAFLSDLDVWGHSLTSMKVNKLSEELRGMSYFVIVGETLQELE